MSDINFSLKNPSCQALWRLSAETLTLAGCFQPGRGVAAGFPSEKSIAGVRGQIAIADRCDRRANGPRRQIRSETPQPEPQSGSAADWKLPPPIRCAT